MLNFWEVSLESSGRNKLTPDSGQCFNHLCPSIRFLEISLPQVLLCLVPKQKRRYLSKKRTQPEKAIRHLVMATLFSDRSLAPQIWVAMFSIPRDPITLSDDEWGVLHHLRNARYLGSMKPFSVYQDREFQLVPTMNFLVPQTFGVTNFYDSSPCCGSWNREHKN